ncbi:hypothetical protein R3W88_006505 [Solanum pinnatisectum]|uniref:Uncharacterized protein n=1 Tax=Solanum pinnatisectum TaxID=50273 RepID=A0AAV9KFP5_9SOLN|nr:hypothetical protein R3W88_006505 [Solanum pinnatisectum]
MEKVLLILPSNFSFSNPKKLLIPLRRSKGKISAHRNDSCDWDYRGRLVDESMIILRKRVHEMKVIERNYEPPAEWIEWEKQYYANYDELICNLVGYLQIQLLSTRPSLALGLLILFIISVPASTAMIFSHFIHLTSGVLSTVHLG